MAEPESTAEQPTLAARLDHLFRTTHPTPGRTWTYREVADAISQAGGPTISRTYLMYLRKGVRDRPRLDHLEAIAKFFNVPTNYLIDDELTDRMVEDLDILQAIHDDSARAVVLQLRDLSPDSVDAVLRMVEALGAAERRGQE